MDTNLLAPVLALALTASAAFGAEAGGEGPSSGFSVGIDALVRGEASRNFDLGDLTFTPGREEAELLLRLRPAVDVQSSRFTARAEAQWYTARGAEVVWEGSLYQGYLETRLPAKLSVKAGRQELVYGSGFLLGADSFYDGLSFDALKLKTEPLEGLSADLFGGRYVRRNSGGIEGELYGAYATYAAHEGLTLDLYALHDTGGAGLTHRQGRHERTHTVGARLVVQVGEGVGLEVEPAYQFGRKLREGASPSHDEIRAFGGHADLTVGSGAGTFPGQLLLSYAYGSGDGDPHDGTFREFHNPDNDTALVGDIGLIGDLSGVSVGEVAASGLQVFTAGLGWNLAKSLDVSVDAHYFRANRVPDGLSRNIGLEVNLILTCRVREDVSVLVGANRFFTGAFFEKASGRGGDVDYGYVQVQASL